MKSMQMLKHCTGDGMFFSLLVRETFGIKVAFGIVALMVGLLFLLIITVLLAAGGLLLLLLLFAVWFVRIYLFLKRKTRADTTDTRTN
jgi:steroid 5-alpha reductase family enzyme